MHSSNGISDVPATSFSFKVDGGHWIKVAAGKTVIKNYKHPVTQVLVRFGTGVQNAILPSCHHLIKYGSADIMKTYPWSKQSFPVFSAYQKVVRQVPIENGNAFFTVTNLGSHYCVSSNADCMVYDCSPVS